MIALYGCDERAVLGVAAMLDIDKIPYRRISDVEQAGENLLVVCGAGRSASAALPRPGQPALILHGGVAIAECITGGTARCEMGAWSVGLDAPVWAQDVVAVATTFAAANALRVPLAPVCQVTGGDAEVLAHASGGEHPAPAIVRRGEVVWCAADLGTAFAHLMNESYWPPGRGSGWRAGAPLGRRAAEAVYYALPQRWRRQVQRRTYARLERMLGARPEPATAYPVDATGWLLLELFEQLVKLAAGWVVRLERWPAPYSAAAALTHDIEPRRYAYTTGLRRLLQTACDTRHPLTVGLVATASARYLDPAALQRLRAHETLCHGRTHRGEPADGRARVLDGLCRARRQLAAQLQRPIAGYRSPRLERSSDLLWALDAAGFDYDSSYPDVDRENVTHFGAGVRLNVPYRPLLDDADRAALRVSRCLELPVAAPDCIQPLFAGDGVPLLRAAFDAKAAFIRATGGLCVAIVHAGVFGDEDAALREAHLRFAHLRLRHAGTWLTDLGSIARWWRSREALRLSVHHGEVQVANLGEHPVIGVRLVIDGPASVTTLRVPPLQPGARTVITLPEGVLTPAA